MKFSLDVEYSMTAQAGFVSLIIQSTPGVIGYQQKRLTKGTGKLTLTAEIEVPKARRVEVIVALYHDDGRSTSVTDSRTYEVRRE